MQDSRVNIHYNHLHLSMSKFFQRISLNISFHSLIRHNRVKLDIFLRISIYLLIQNNPQCMLMHKCLCHRQDIDLCLHNKFHTSLFPNSNLYRKNYIRYCMDHNKRYTQKNKVNIHFHADTYLRDMYRHNNDFQLGRSHRDINQDIRIAIQKYTKLLYHRK